MKKRRNWLLLMGGSILCILFYAITLFPQDRIFSQYKRAFHEIQHPIGTNSITPLASATAAVTTASETTVSCSETLTPVPVTTAEFTVPAPDIWVMLMNPVREYFYYRKKAVVEGNIQVLWDRYPDLKQGTDLSKGINAEASLVENMKGLKPFDGNISPESYERIKVFLTDRQAEILVHGTELFLFEEQGQFQDSGGEFKILLFVCSQDHQQWTVFKTDEVTLAEWNARSP